MTTVKVNSDAVNVQASSYASGAFLMVQEQNRAAALHMTRTQTIELALMLLQTIGEK